MTQEAALIELSMSIDRLTESIEALQNTAKLTIFTADSVRCPYCDATGIPLAEIGAVDDVVQVHTKCSSCRAIIKKEVLDGRYIG